MVRRFSSTLLLLVTLTVMGFSAGCSVRHTTLLPGSEMEAAAADSISLAVFLDLPDDAQADRRRRAERALRPLEATEAAHAAMEIAVKHVFMGPGLGRRRQLPRLGDVIEHLDLAVGLDPTLARMWLARGRLLDLAGDEHRARESLQAAWAALEAVVDDGSEHGRLRRDVAVTAAWLERDGGWWDAGLDWLDRAEAWTGADDSEAVLLRGLLLAGRGDLVDAMALSYGLPPMEILDVSNMGWNGFMGLKKKKTDMLKRWLQADVWMRRGRGDLAWAVLGRIPYWRRVVVLPYRLYQDLGTYAEISGDPYRANLYYALAYIRRQYRRSIMPVPLQCDPVIRGVPHAGVSFFRMEGGGFHGGSLRSYAMSSSMLALLAEGGPDAERSYQLALSALETCMRRGISPDEALAMRGRLRFSRGYYVLAEIDLARARSIFAESGQIESMTSYLLGLVAMGRDRPAEAVTLLEEAISVDTELAGAWDVLGVARLQLGRRAEARHALDRAVELAPRQASARFNRGLLRCQEGDLDGGLADLETAASLSPDDQQIGRIIQLANLARREGRSFLPGMDGAGRWQPAAVKVDAHDGGRFGPVAVDMDELMADVSAEVGMEARAEGLDAAMLKQLQDQYEAEPTPLRRKLLAHAFLWLDLPGEARRVLAPHWGADLDRDETMLLLWLDQRAGEADRLRDISVTMGLELSLEVSRYDWNAVMSLLTMTPTPNRAQAAMQKVDASVQSTSYGGQFARWVEKQFERMRSTAGEEGTGDMLVHYRGRTYRFDRGGGIRRSHPGLERK